MAKCQKQTPKLKAAGAQGSRSPSDKDFTCSEVQLDNLLSEGESTGQLRPRSKDGANRGIQFSRRGASR
jgi:hypothetical protein